MNNLAELKRRICNMVAEAESIGITTHLNPDGDGYCAALALQKIISAMGKKSVIWMDEDNLKRFDFLLHPALSLASQNPEVQIFYPDIPLSRQKTDLLFVVDCNSYERIGMRRSLLDNSGFIALLDHHILENHPIQADLAFIDTAYVSVGAIIHELFQEEIASLPSADKVYVANCLYTTILNDTNNFANANTNAEVFELAAELSRLGIKPNLLYKEFFLNHAAEEMRYVGQTLSTIALHHDRRILSMYSTQEMSLENQVDPESVMNITRWVQGVAGIDAIVYLLETSENTFKISLRSINLDVNAIAVKYGGGGHRQASGCTILGTREEVLSKLLSDIQQAITEYDQNR
ncbi:bifunctional oligoribonuclease/PAP phosphatase NrnA [Candidatus Cloacimonadaceae bacterium]